MIDVDGVASIAQSVDNVLLGFGRCARNGEVIYDQDKNSAIGVVAVNARNYGVFEVACFVETVDVEPIASQFAGIFEAESGFDNFVDDSIAVDIWSEVIFVENVVCIVMKRDGDVDLLFWG